MTPAHHRPAQRAVLEVRGLGYEIGRRELFRQLELTVSAGESVAATGPSGVGKSTLLSCVLGLVRPKAGSVTVAGGDVTVLRGRALARLRQRYIGTVFQSGELLPELTPADNVALAALLSGDGRVNAYARARALLAELEVPDEVETRYLSGGERQRTAVARALINAPVLLLADEPTGALDSVMRDRVADMLFALPRSRHCGLLVVTHDDSVAERADRVLRLHEGALAPLAAAWEGA